MRILPAIDLKNGHCVRLLQGDFNRVTKYNSDPLAQANYFKSNQLNHLHIVDLDGAKTGNQLNVNIIKTILEISDITLQVGGGIRSIQKVESMLNMGVSRVIIGTALFQENFLQDLKIVLLGLNLLFDYWFQVRSILIVDLCHIQPLKLFFYIL